MEKMAMSAFFPEFEISVGDEGRIRYNGTLKSEKFRRAEGYQVCVDYYNGGVDNWGNPGIVITPTKPTFNELFPDYYFLSKVLKNDLLYQDAVKLRCIRYENPVIRPITTIITGASLLRNTVNWCYEYEQALNRAKDYYIESQNFIALKKFEYRKGLFGFYRFSPSYSDYITAKRRQLKEHLLKGESVKITPHNSFTKWWDEIIVDDLAKNFPDFKYRVEEEKTRVKFDIITQHVLYIELTIYPGSYFEIKCQIKLIYRGDTCYTFIDEDSTNKICATLGCVPFPLNCEDGLLFIAGLEHPLRMILLVFNWFNDLEDVIISKLDNKQFYEVYKNFRGMTAHNSGSWSSIY